MLKGVNESRRSFLNDLPATPIKQTIQKIVFIAIVGFLLSILSITIVAITWKGNINNNSTFFPALFAQNVPFFILTLILFYKKKVNNNYSSTGTQSCF